MPGQCPARHHPRSRPVNRLHREVLHGPASHRTVRHDRFLARRQKFTDAVAAATTSQAPAFSEVLAEAREFALARLGKGTDGCETTRVLLAQRVELGAESTTGFIQLRCRAKHPDPACCAREDA